MKLLSKHTATLSRVDSSGSWDDSGNYIPPSRTNNVDIKCVIQPDRKESVYQNKLPEGIHFADYRIMRTKTPIYTANDETKEPADNIIFNGVTYEVFIANPWDSPTERLSHYECVIIRKDLLR